MYLIERLRTADNKQGQHEDSNGNTAAVAHVALVEGNLVSIHRHNHGCRTRSALCHNEDVIKGFHVTCDTEGDTVPTIVFLISGSVMYTAFWNAVCAINLRTLKNIRGDGCDRRKDNNHIISDILPDQRDRNKQHNELWYCLTIPDTDPFRPIAVRNQLSIPYLL